MYLKVVDRYNDQSISAFVTPSSKFYGLTNCSVTALTIHTRDIYAIPWDYAFSN